MTSINEKLFRYAPISHATESTSLQHSLEAYYGRETLSDTQLLSCRKWLLECFDFNKMSHLSVANDEICISLRTVCGPLIGVGRDDMML